MLEYLENNPDYANSHLEYEKVFNLITISILKKRIEIAHELSLPLLAKPLYEFFLSQLQIDILQTRDNPQEFLRGCKIAKS